MDRPSYLRTWDDMLKFVANDLFVKLKPIVMSAVMGYGMTEKIANQYLKDKSEEFKEFCTNIVKYMVYRYNNGESSSTEYDFQLYLWEYFVIEFHVHQPQNMNTLAQSFRSHIRITNHLRQCINTH